MLSGMQHLALPTPRTRPIGWSGAAAVIAGALPLLPQGTRRGEDAGHRPAPTTATTARLLWLAIAATLGRWLAEAVVKPQMGPEGLGWLALLPVALVTAAGLATVAEGLLRRRGWARWAAVVAFSLIGVTALTGLVEWAGAVARSRASGWGRPPPTAARRADIRVSPGGALPGACGPRRAARHRGGSSRPHGWCRAAVARGR
jgi:hypothetical protein